MIINILFVTYKISILKFVINKPNIFIIGNIIMKTKTSRDDLTSKSKETKKLISERNICNRVFEVYRKNDDSSLDKLDNRFNAERELSGYYMYSITKKDS